MPVFYLCSRLTDYLCLPRVNWSPANYVKCMNLTREHTQLQQARVCDFLHPRPVVVTHSCVMTHMSKRFMRMAGIRPHQPR